MYSCTSTSCGTTQLLGQLSGTATGTYTSPTGYMLMSFTSDSTRVYDGFTASWTSATVPVNMPNHPCAYIVLLLRSGVAMFYNEDYAAVTVNFM